MPQDIPLDGLEICVLKAIGIGGSETSGETVLERAGNLEPGEIMDCLRGLIGLGYVESDRSGLNSLDEMKKANFHINSGYIKPLREAMDPRPEPRKSKRVRRE